MTCFDPKTIKNHVFRQKMTSNDFISSKIRHFSKTVLYFWSLTSPNFKIPLKSNYQLTRSHFWVSITFPIALTVGSSYWIISALNRDLLVNDDLRKALPAYLDHMLHTAPIVFQFINVRFFRHDYVELLERVYLTGFTSAVYLITVIGVHHVSGKWAYPLLSAIMDTPYYYGFIGIYVSLLYTGMSTMVLGSRMNATFHRCRTKMQSRQDIFNQMRSGLKTEKTD